MQLLLLLLQNVLAIRSRNTCISSSISLILWHPWIRWCGLLLKSIIVAFKFIRDGVINIFIWRKCLGVFIMLDWSSLGILLIDEVVVVVLEHSKRRRWRINQAKLYSWSGLEYFSFFFLSFFLVCFFNLCFCFWFSSSYWTEKQTICEWSCGLCWPSRWKGGKKALLCYEKGRILIIWKKKYMLLPQYFSVVFQRLLI